MIDIRKRAIGITDVAALRRLADFDPAYLHGAGEAAAVVNGPRMSKNVQQASSAFGAA